MTGTLDDKKRLQRSSNIKIASAIGCGLLTALVAGTLDALSGSVAELVVVPLLFVGFISAFVLWYWGLTLYAQGKGYARVLGLLGLLGIPGLLILLLLPDEFKVAPEQAEGWYPRPTPHP